MLRCEVSLFDWIFTIVILYILFIIDIILTFVNLNNLKKIFPKKYINYELNFFIKKLIKKYGLEKSMLIYSILGILLFTLAVIFVPIHANLVIGILIALVFLIHIPNYFEIKKRLKNKVK